MTKDRHRIHDGTSLKPFPPRTAQTEPLLEHDQKEIKTSDYILAFLKSNRLLVLLGPLSSLFGPGLKEEKKTVIDRDRWATALRSVIYVVPLAAALCILILNATSYYIGGELSGISGQDFEKLAALQFAAKVHELLMLASLTSLLITHIRRELAFGSGIPFGTLFSPLEFKDISFLWSAELWGSINEDWKSRKKRKWVILGLIFTCSVLGFSVGPSTANLMKPRLADWPAGGTLFWVNSTSLFPTTIDDSPELSHCNVDHGDLACPAGAWQVLNDNYYSYWPRLANMGSLPESWTTPSPYSLRQFSALSRNVNGQNDQIIWGNAYTVASSPVSVIADGVAEVSRLWAYAAQFTESPFRYRNDADFVVHTSQPMALAFCGQNEAYSITTLPFPDLNTLSLAAGPNTAAVSWANTEAWFNMYGNQTVLSKVYSQLQPGLPPSIVWVDDPALLESISGSLGAIFVLPSTNASSNGTFFPCSIDARLAPSTLQASRDYVKYVSGMPSGFDSNGTFESDWPRIMLKAKWANYLTPQIPATNHTILSPISQTAGIWNTTLTSDSAWLEQIVENIITTLVANGMSRLSYNTSLLWNLKGPIDPNDEWSGGEWAWEILPKNKKIGPGGNAFDISAAAKKHATQFNAQVTVNGYAYSPSGTIQVAMMIVLGVYIVVFLSHLLFINLKGVSSGSWGSAAEMTALAMNSHYAAELENTGAGISTTKVFGTNVTIREREERLQFVFHSSALKARGYHIKENVTYA